jgi:peptide/nickel transport system permease protein
MTTMASPGTVRFSVRRLAEPGAVTAIGATMLAVIILATIIVPILSPFGYDDQDLASFLLAPGSRSADGFLHLFGTDSLGRDVFTRVFLGGRYSLFVSLLSITGALIIGCSLGLLAGYVGGWVDDIVMRICDLQLAFPLVLLALAIVALLGGSVSIMVLVFILTIWPVFARTVRGSVLVIREQPFVESARSIGASSWRIALKHIMPNTLSAVIVVATFQFATVIIYESSLGFLGLGVQPPTPTWGNMMAEGRQFLSVAWWITLFPGAILVLATLSANLLGGGVERLLDPRKREL